MLISLVGFMLKAELFQLVFMPFSFLQTDQYRYICDQLIINQTVPADISLWVNTYTIYIFKFLVKNH